MSDNVISEYENIIDHLRAENAALEKQVIQLTWEIEELNREIEGLEDSVDYWKEFAGE